MEDINSLKVVLAEKKRTNRWLAEENRESPLLQSANGVQILHSQTCQP